MTDLFCLPFAGAGPTVFRALTVALDSQVRVRPVSLPGRESRFSESPRFTLDSVAAEIAGQIDGPYAVYGHSMGARLGAEVLDRLAQTGLPAPVALVVGAANPPDVPDPLAERYRNAPEQALAKLRELGAVDDGAFDHPELRSLLLPILHSDLAWIRDEPVISRPAVNLPIMAVCGRHDRSSGPSSMSGWRRWTRLDTRLELVADGHFFLRRPELGLADAIADFLRLREAPANVIVDLRGVNGCDDMAAEVATSGTVKVAVGIAGPCHDKEVVTRVLAGASTGYFSAAEVAELQGLPASARITHGLRLLSARRAVRRLGDAPGGTEALDFSGQAGMPTWHPRASSATMPVSAWHIELDEAVVAVACPDTSSRVCVVIGAPGTTS
jgi:surfactin synthase thioesterase subunit